MILKQMRSKISAIIFDCDGVLVDSEFIASQVSLRMLEPYGVKMTLQDYTRLFAGKVEEDIIGIIKNEYNIVLPEDYVPKLKLAIEHALDHELEAIPGVRETLSKIQKKVGVASNSRLVRVIHSLKIAGLSDIFEKNLFAAEMVAQPKPYPDVYLLAAEKLHVNPNECLVVEDSETGVTAATAAGMHVVGFLGASHIYEGHEQKLINKGAFATVNNMQELDDLLQQIE